MMNSVSDDLTDKARLDQKYTGKANDGSVAKIWKQGEYMIFRMSQTNFNSKNIEKYKNSYNIKKRISKKVVSMETIKKLASKLNIKSMIDGFLSKKQFGGAASIFIVVPTSDDNDGETSSNDGNSISSIQPIKNNIVMDTTSEDPDTAQRKQLSSTSGAQVCGRGKKFYVQEVSSSSVPSKKAAYNLQIQKVLRVHEKKINLRNQINIPKRKGSEKYHTRNSISIDTTADRPCCCCSNLTMGIDSSREDYVANVLSEHMMSIFLREGRNRDCCGVSKTSSSSLESSFPVKRSSITMSFPMNEYPDVSLMQYSVQSPMHSKNTCKCSSSPRYDQQESSLMDSTADDPLDDPLDYTVDTPSLMKCEIPPCMRHDRPKLNATKYPDASPTHSSVRSPEYPYQQHDHYNSSHKDYHDHDCHSTCPAHKCSRNCLGHCNKHKRSENIPQPSKKTCSKTPKPPPPSPVPQCTCTSEELGKLLEIAAGVQKALNNGKEMTDTAVGDSEISPKDITIESKGDCAACLERENDDENPEKAEMCPCQKHYSVSGPELGPKDDMRSIGTITNLSGSAFPKKKSASKHSSMEPEQSSSQQSNETKKIKLSAISKKMTKVATRISNAGKSIVPSAVRPSVAKPRLGIAAPTTEPGLETTKRGSVLSKLSSIVPNSVRNRSVAPGSTQSSKESTASSTATQPSKSKSIITTADKSVETKLRAITPKRANSSKTGSPKLSAQQSTKSTAVKPKANEAVTTELSSKTSKTIQSTKIDSTKASASLSTEPKAVIPKKSKSIQSTSTKPQSVIPDTATYNKSTEPASNKPNVTEQTVTKPNLITPTSKETASNTALTKTMASQSDSPEPKIIKDIVPEPTATDPDSIALKNTESVAKPSGTQSKTIEASNAEPTKSKVAESESPTSITMSVTAYSLNKSRSITSRTTESATNTAASTSRTTQFEFSQSDTIEPSVSEPIKFKAAKSESPISVKTSSTAYCLSKSRSITSKTTESTTNTAASKTRATQFESQVPSIAHFVKSKPAKSESPISLETSVAAFSVSKFHSITSRTIESATNTAASKSRGTQFESPQAGTIKFSTTNFTKSKSARSEYHEPIIISIPEYSISKPHSITSKNTESATNTAITKSKAAQFRSNKATKVKARGAHTSKPKTSSTFSEASKSQPPKSIIPGIVEYTISEHCSIISRTAESATNTAATKSTATQFDSPKHIITSIAEYNTSKPHSILNKIAKISTNKPHCTVSRAAQSISPNPIMASIAEDTHSQRGWLIPGTAKSRASQCTTIKPGFILPGVAGSRITKPNSIVARSNQPSTAGTKSNNRHSSTNGDNIYADHIITCFDNSAEFVPSESYSNTHTPNSEIDAKLHATAQVNNKHPHEKNVSLMERESIDKNRNQLVSIKVHTEDSDSMSNQTNSWSLTSQNPESLVYLSGPESLTSQLSEQSVNKITKFSKNGDNQIIFSEKTKISGKQDQGSTQRSSTEQPVTKTILSSKNEDIQIPPSEKNELSGIQIQEATERSFTEEPIATMKSTSKKVNNQNTFLDKTELSEKQPLVANKRSSTEQTITKMASSLKTSDNPVSSPEKIELSGKLPDIAAKKSSNKQRATKTTPFAFIKNYIKPVPEAPEETKVSRSTSILGICTPFQGSAHESIDGQEGAEGNSCGWIDVAELLRMRSIHSLKFSGLTFCTKKKLPSEKTDELKQKEVILNFDEAVKYYTKMHPEMFEDLIPKKVEEKKNLAWLLKKTKKNKEKSVIQPPINKATCSCPYGRIPPPICYDITKSQSELTEEEDTMKGLRFDIIGKGSETPGLADYMYPD